MPCRVSLGLAFLVIAQGFAQSPRQLFDAGKYREAAQAAAGRPDALAVLIQARLELESPPPPDLLELTTSNLSRIAKAYGERSPEYGEALFLLGEAHRQQGNAKSAAADYEQARRLCAGHAEFSCEAESMRVEAVMRGNRSDYVEAQKLGKAAWELHQERLGTSAPLTARALAFYGEHFLFTDHARCRELEDAAIAILRKTVGPDHPYLAYALNVRGSAARHLGDYPAARRLFEESLRIREVVYGPEHRILIAPSNNLGLTFKQMGDFENARKYLSRTVQIGERRLGAEHPMTVQALGNLAIVQEEDGDIVGALRTKERVVEIERRSPETMTLASNLNSLAAAQREVGDLTAARTLLEESLAMTTRLAGEGNQKTIEVLISLAHVDSDTRNYASAVARTTRALELAHRYLGPDHPQVSRALRSRGAALLEVGSVDEARHDLLQALELSARVTPQSSSLADAYRALARVALFQRRWDEAEKFSDEAIANLTAVHDRNYYALADLWSFKAKACAGLGHTKEALEAALECERIGRATRSVLAQGLTERNAILSGIRWATGPEVLTSLAIHDPALVGVAWDAVIYNRSLVLDAVAERGQFARSSESPAVRRLAEALAARRSELARAVMTGRRSLSAGQYTERLERLQSEAEKAELALADLSAGFRVQRLAARAGLSDVQRSLPPRSALVAFQRTEDRFVAYVTRGPGTEPAAVDLGSASRIETLIRAWRAEIVRELESGGRSQKINEQRSRAAGESLRQAVWDPFAASVKGAERVFLVPDGALVTVNFAALPLAADKYLVEAGPLLHILSTERDLLRPPVQSGAGILAVSNPKFSAASSPARAPIRRGVETPCVDRNAMSFPPLPGAAAEAQAIVTDFGEASHLTGLAATESSVKQLASGKRVLHFATHAFFLEKSCQPGTILEQNPLLRAGIALAGANERPSTGEDGILTAAEIAGMNLNGVEWAVLSGCNTGAGDVLAGEGVLGLRRAFQIAGAASVIASLWSVDDEETRRWMVALYRARFVQKRDTAQALRAAQIARLNTRRAARLSVHPFYWAGFIAVGDWR